MSSRVADSTPPPTLRICYRTAFGTFSDPRLYTTLLACHASIAVRQRDFETSLWVTVTDVTTQTILYETHYERPTPFIPPWFLSPFLLLSSFLEMDLLASVGGC